MRQTQADLRAAELRDQAHEELVEHYINQAILAARGELNDDGTPIAFLNVRGHEVPDPTVVEPPLGYVPQPDLMEQMRRMVRNELSRLAEDSEAESFEEADDFDIDDDPVDYSSPYEEFFDPAPGAPTGPPAPAAADPNAPAEPVTSPGSPSSPSPTTGSADPAGASK